MKILASQEATDEFVAIAKRIADRSPRRHGRWAFVAGVLGISNAHLSNIIRGRKKVAMGVVLRAKEEESKMRTEGVGMPQFAASQARSMLEEMEREDGHRNRLSDRTGLSRSYINKLLHGERTTIGGGCVRIIRRFAGVREEFFFHSDSAGKSYREFLAEPGEEESAATKEFVEVVREIMTHAPVASTSLGWASKHVGMEPKSLSKVLRGEKRVGRGMVEAAHEALRFVGSTPIKRSAQAPERAVGVDVENRHDERIGKLSRAVQALDEHRNTRDKFVELALAADMSVGWIEDRLKAVSRGHRMRAKVTDLSSVADRLAALGYAEAAVAVMDLMLEKHE